MARKLTFAVMALCALAGTGCTVYATRCFTLTDLGGPYDRIVVHSANGKVHLTCGEVQELRIDGEKRVNGASFAGAEANLDALEVVAKPDEQDPTTLRIEVRIPETLADLSPGADLMIKAPTPCAVDISTSNGPIYLASAKDQALLETSNARIEVEQVRGSVVAHSSNGSIQAAGINGDLTARTSNGSIRASAIQGACRLHTTNGSIRVYGASGNVQADTSNGSIHLKADAPEDAQITLRTSNGAIEASLPRQLKGELRLSTSNAAVHAGLLNVPVEIKYQDEGDLRAVLNGGGPGGVTAETSNGSIWVDFR
jgi:hypothetical protein